MIDLNARLLADGVALKEIQEALEALSVEDQITAVRALKPKSQRVLWDLADGQAVQMEDMVPTDKAPLEPVRHYGKNSLPMFTHFEKRFCRPSADSDEIRFWGYNHQPNAWATGPGYFVCHEVTGTDMQRGAVVIDYYEVPPEKPEGWPAIKSNERGTARVVYGFMHDFMRRVTGRVSVGRAWKHGKATNNFFVLVREA